MEKNNQNHLSQIVQAIAGREEKSDVLVQIEKKNSDGIEIALESSVKSMFGMHIQHIVKETLKTLNIDHAFVTIKDFGAFDYVIQARLEAAIRMLWTIPEPGIIPKTHIPKTKINKERIRRTRLYIPGNNPDQMINASLFGADSIILDLEDSVTPSDKDAARLLVRNALLAIDFGASERIVRINPLSTPYGLKDLEAIIPTEPNILLIPKCESKSDVTGVEEMVIYHEQKNKLISEIYLMPLIETAKGILHAYEIAMASNRVVALCFGAEDFTADVGTQRTVEGKESLVARSILVMAAKAAGIQALDTVYSDVEDIEGLITSTKEAIALGFDGKGVIHPRQIKPVHEAFTPTPEQIKYAQSVISALKDAEQKRSGVASLGSKMIDAPVVTRAKKILQLAKEMGLLDDKSQ